MSLIETSQTIINECDQTMSPDIPGAASSSCLEDQEDKDDSWMQFITDDAWYSSNASAMVGGGGDEFSHVTFTN